MISLFGLATAKPVQADTSVADIQKEANWLSVSNKTFPIWLQGSQTGTFSGIETDLAKMVADELKVKVRYVPVTAQTRGPLLDNEQVDMDIATFTITDERKNSTTLPALTTQMLLDFWSINLPKSKILRT